MAKAKPSATAKSRRTRAPKRVTGVRLGADVARNQILFGAARVFAQKGYRGVAVEELLEAAQVSRRTFYRFFKSKDDVALAMYTFGTALLLESCRRAIAADNDLLARLERCVDLHLTNARQMGRIVWVLGGEAQSLESPLYPRRMEVHDRLVQMFMEVDPGRPKVDPLIVRTLVIALEQVTRAVLAEGDEGRRVTQASIARARAVMLRVATATVAGEGDRVAPMPMQRPRDTASRAATEDGNAASNEASNEASSESG